MNAEARGLLMKGIAEMDDQGRFCAERDTSDFGVSTPDSTSCPPAEPVASEESEAASTSGIDEDETDDSGLEGTETADDLSATSSLQGRHQSELEELRQLQFRQRQGLSMSRNPLSTVHYFFLALVDQLCSVMAHMAGSKIFFGSILVVFSTASVLVALDLPSVTVAHAFLSYLSFCLWWIILGILSSIGLGTGLQTFLLYLAPHVARFTLKATACGRTDIKAAPYDTALWGASDTWSARACTEFGEPQYPHFPGEHGGYYAVPLLHLVLSVLPEAMLWGAGTAIGELPPFLIARAARLSGERARALDELMSEDSSAESNGNEAEYHLLPREGSEHIKDDPRSAASQSSRIKAQGPTSQRGEEAQESGPWLERVFRRAKVWLFSQGRELGFLTIIFLAAIPNPLFDLAGLTCGHFLVPAWKFFTATLLGKSFVKAPSQALVVAIVFNAHSIELLEDALDTLSREQVPLLGEHLLPWLTTSLDTFRVKMALGGAPAARRSRSLSISTIWTSFVVLMFLAFLCSIVTSTARAYLLHQQQQDLLRLQQQLKLKQALLHAQQHQQGKSTPASAKGETEDEAARACEESHSDCKANLTCRAGSDGPQEAGMGR